MPCVESGPPGLRAALSQRCPGERKTDGALSRLGVARSRPCRVIPLAGLAGVYARATRARRLATLLLPMASPGFVARSQVLSGPNVQSVQRGAAVKVGFTIKSSKAPTRVRTSTVDKEMDMDAGGG